MTIAPLPTQYIRLRSGDDLPGFAAIIEDDAGNPLDLTDATAKIRVVAPDGLALVGDCFIPNPTTGVVTFDWAGQATALLEAGVYELTVTAVWADGRQITAPSDRTFGLIIRTGQVLTICTVDDLDIYTVDGLAVIPAQPVIEPALDDDALLTTVRHVIRTVDNRQVLIAREDT